MEPTPATKRVVEVAIGAVVEKVSTIQSYEPNTIQHGDLFDAARDDLRVLITLRRDEQVLGGLWELPGGKIETTEAAQDAVERELYEEVGITAQAIEALPSVEHTYEHACIRLQPFICTRIRGCAEAIEVADVRWVGLDELASYRFPEASLPVIESLKRLLDAYAAGETRPGESSGHGPA